MPDPAEKRFEGVTCTLTIRRPWPGIVVVVFTGHDVGEFGDAAFQELDRLLTLSPGLELFIDARAGKTASVDVSNGWSQWLRAHKGQLRCVSMLTGSKFIQLSADFVRRFADMGDVMRLYTDGATFDAALDQALATARAW